MNPPSTTDAFINWAESFRDAPDQLRWLILQRQRFNTETWESLFAQLGNYIQSHIIP